MERIILKNILANPFKVMRNYNRLVEWQFLAEQKLQQFEADNEMLQNELDCVHISHDWYVKWEKAQNTIKNMQAVITSRDTQISELQQKVQNQKRQLRELQENHNEAKLCKIPYSDRAYVRKLQEQLARKCERIEELKIKVAQLEGDIVTLAVPEAQ